MAVGNAFSNLLRLGGYLLAIMCVSSACVDNAWAQQRFAGPTSSSELYNSMPAWQGSNWFGNQPAQGQDWKLGVQCDDLDTGVFVRQVAPGSAAQRANLEVNDVIVAVGGQQVGIVEGRYVDMSAEIRRRADANGNVNLLVQDGRSGKLASIRVQLDGNQSVIRGVLIRQDRAYLPSDAVVTVYVENMSRKYFAVRNDRVSFVPTTQNNIPFEINYDASYIAPNDVYEVKAQVVSGGRVIYRSAQGVRALGGAPSDGVRIELVPEQNLASTPSSYGPVITASGYGSSDPNSILQYQQIYRKYLGRDPTQLELAGFMYSANTAAELETLPLTLMASQQYYDAVGNNNAAWITAVFQQIIGRPATIQERDQWINYFNDLRGSRIEVLRQLYKYRR